MDKNFQYIVDKMGPPKDGRPLTSEQIRFFNQHFPENYVEFIATYGFGHYFDRGFWFVDPQEFRSIIALTFKADSDFSHNDCHVVGYSAFGDLVVWSEQYFVTNISLLKYEVRNQKLGPYVSNVPLPKNVVPRPVGAFELVRGVIPRDEETRELWDFPDQEPMFARCVKEHGALEHGEVYGFVPSLGMVGYNSRYRRVEHVKRVKALEHFAIIAQMGEFSLVRHNMGKTEVVRQIG